MPLHLDHCYVDVPNCTEWNETNGSNTSNWTRTSCETRLEHR